MDGCCEGGLGQQMNDGGGCARKIGKSGEPLCIFYLTDSVSRGHFCSVFS